MNSQPESNTHLCGRWLLLARTAWLALALLGVLVFVVGDWAALHEPPPVCADPQSECDPLDLGAEDVAEFQQLGWPVDSIAGLHFASGFARRGENARRL